MGGWILQGEASNLVLVNVKKENRNLSNSMETLNLERSYLQGFICGSAWRDGIIASMQSSNSFRITHPVNYLQRFDVPRNESLDKAIDWPAFHMTSQQTTYPGLIFSNWENLSKARETISSTLHKWKAKCTWPMIRSLSLSLSEFVFINMFHILWDDGPWAIYMWCSNHPVLS